METSLAVINHEELETIQRTARMLAVSSYFEAKGDTPVALAQIAVKILAGRELGFGPFAAVKGIHIIQGSPSVSASLMASAVKGSRRYDYRVREHTAQVCRIEFFERAYAGKWEPLGVSEFTADDAKRAGTKNMDKYPKNMLFARAMSNGVRFYCPDVFSGVAVYTPEELGADVDADGDVVDAYPTRPETLQRPQASHTSEYTANGTNAPHSAPDAPTEPVEHASEDAPPLHQWCYDRLDGKCAKFADWSRTKHANSSGPATAAMYQYLTGVIDGITGNTTHKDVLAVLVGRPVNQDNPPGYDLVSQLLDWLPETIGKGEEKQANPKHEAKYVPCIRAIGELVLQAQGQTSLFG